MLVQLECKLINLVNLCRVVMQERLISLEQLQTLRAEYETCCKSWPVAAVGHDKARVNMGYRKLKRAARWLRLVETRHYRTSALAIHMEHPCAVRAMSWFTYRCAEEVIYYRLREEGKRPFPKRQRCPLTVDFFNEEPANEAVPVWAVNTPVGFPRLAISSLV